MGARSRSSPPISASDAKPPTTSGRGTTDGPAGLPCTRAPVAQRKSGGLLSRWSGVRVPPGALSVSKPISPEAPANQPNWPLAASRRFVTTATGFSPYCQGLRRGGRGWTGARVRCRRRATEARLAMRCGTRNTSLRASLATKTTAHSAMARCSTASAPGAAGAARSQDAGPTGADRRPSSPCTVEPCEGSDPHPTLVVAPRSRHGEGVRYESRETSELVPWKEFRRFGRRDTPALRG